VIRAGSAALAIALAALAAPALAGEAMEVETTCPVGGETFTYVTTAGYSVYGQRPDGKPYGSWTFPLALPQCPSNALVVYREFKPEEIAALTALVQSPEYQALRPESPYFRAAWLAQRMDAADPFSALFLLLSATWEVDDAPETKARYQRAFAEGAISVPIDVANIDTLFLHYRRANALRELGDFAGARAALDVLPRAALDVNVPKDRKVPYSARSDASSRRFLFDNIPLMRKVIEAGDSSSFPIELMDSDMAGWACADLTDAGAPLHPRCAEPAVREQMQDILDIRRNNPPEDEASAADIAEAAEAAAHP
jgi:hypothetical protein